MLCQHKYYVVVAGRCGVAAAAGMHLSASGLGGASVGPQPRHGTEPCHVPAT
jgi:hypothetical protein